MPVDGIHVIINARNSIVCACRPHGGCHAETSKRPLMASAVFFVDSLHMTFLKHPGLMPEQMKNVPQAGIAAVFWAPFHCFGRVHIGLKGMICREKDYSGHPFFLSRFTARRMRRGRRAGYHLYRHGRRVYSSSLLGSDADYRDFDRALVGVTEETVLWDEEGEPIAGCRTVGRPAGNHHRARDTGKLPGAGHGRAHPSGEGRRRSGFQIGVRRMQYGFYL